MIEPIELVITGETPAKKNSRITLRNGKTIPSRRYQEWHRRAVNELKSQFNRGPLDCDLKINLCFFHSDNRRRDSDNGVSSIFDTLQDAGIITDDRWQIIRTFSVHNYKASEARCEITIQEISE